MDITAKLLAIQTELHAPKSQFNKFGNYHYRNCEDILEALKPLCKKHEAAITISDEIVLIGDRYYVKATALLSWEDTSMMSIAYAREAESQKGMSEPMLTGSSSSYARKYALNGLFAIDDNKDADSLPHEPEKKPADKPKADKAKKYKDFDFLTKMREIKKKKYRDFDFLTKMREIKKSLNDLTGSDFAYKKLLGMAGYEKSDEIPPDRQIKALKSFNDLLQKEGKMNNA